jgi:hypothetical protein
MPRTMVRWWFPLLPMRSSSFLIGTCSTVSHYAEIDEGTARPGGLSWPDSVIVYPGSSGYSDLAFIHNRTGIGALFESDGYNHIAFKSVPLPLAVT